MVPLGAGGRAFLWGDRRRVGKFAALALSSCRTFVLARNSAVALELAVCFGNSVLYEG